MLNSIVNYLETSALKYPDHRAVVDGDNIYSYRELEQHSQSVASWIIEALEYEKRPVVVLMENSAAAVASFWGIAWSNNIYVPLDQGLPLERIKRIFAILNPIAVIACDINKTSEEVVQFIKENGCRFAAYSDIISFPINEVGIKQRQKKTLDVNPLYIVFTSGSTGEPKGVTISHRAVMDFTEEASETMGFSGSDRFLNQAPFYFDASVPDLFCSVRNGSELHIVPKSYFAFPKKLADYILNNKITQLYWVPSALVAMANLKAVKKEKMNSLKRVMFCGEVMPVKQLNIWRRELPDVVYVNYYGPSEATYACSYYVIDREFDDSEVLPIGKAAINTELLIISTGNKVIRTSGEIGELCIRGSGLSLGYYNNSEKTRDVFVLNPEESNYADIIYRTGDLAHYDEDGNVYYDGRNDQQIKHMGYRIELGEIDVNAGALEGVDKVVSLYFEETDEIVLFYTGKMEKNSIKDELQKKLPHYMIPARVVKLDHMPLNANGKTDRVRLKNEFGGKQNE